MRSMFLRAALVALALFAMPRAADAAWLHDFTGNTIMGQPGGQVDGVVNFGVYQNTGGSGNWLNDLFGSSFNNLSGVDTTAQYVYFYSVVNTAPPVNILDATLISLYIDTGALDVTAGALINATTVAGFNDTQSGMVGSSGNRRFGANNSVGSTVDFIDGQVTSNFSDTSLVDDSVDTGLTPSVVVGAGPSTTTYTTTTGATRPLVNTFPPTAPARAVKFEFSLATGQFSTLLFITSNFRPTIGIGTIKGNSTTGSDYSLGDVPVPTPEPATIAMLGMALPLLGLGYFRRQRANAEPVVG